MEQRRVEHADALAALGEVLEHGLLREQAQAVRDPLVPAGAEAEEIEQAGLARVHAGVEGGERGRQHRLRWPRQRRARAPCSNNLLKVGR